nr:DUF6744 family protein [uncultured Agathobaculum sp.]
MTTNPNGFMVVQNSTDESQLLGKFLYYSLADVLVQKEDFERICTALDFPYAGRRISVVDAFKNATGKVTRRTVAGASGSQEILRIYCRDNMRDGNLYSRELVRETVGLRTNRYDKLANICYDRDTDRMYHDIVENDPSLDVEQLCRNMEDKFRVFRNCLGRSQIDTILLHYLGTLDALPISVYGKLYFVPRDKMHKVDLFEDFLEELNLANQNEKALVVNSFYVADDEKQREKMASEFYTLVRKEAQEYQERAMYLIDSGCQSPSIMERWILRIDDLKQKKQRYEALFRKELSETDAEFDSLQLYSQELQIRADGIRMQRAA